MDASFSRSLRAVWIARWQEMAPRVAFWLLLAGYDLRDRSLGDLLYLPYLLLFWMAWAFAMFTALSGLLATLLQTLNPVTPALVAVSGTFWALVFWAIFSLYRATRRSPLVFSPADATLLCQSPVDRRALTGIWFLTEWPIHVLPFAAWALLAGFALFELRNLVETIDLLIVIHYWIDGLRALSIILALHFLLLALAWTAGAWRLHGRHGNPLARWLPLVVLLLIAPLLSDAWQLGPFSLPDSASWHVVTRPLLAALGEVAWASAFLPVLASALLALATLLVVANRINLGRAAQETSHIYSERFLARVGAHQTASHMKRERMLGAGTQAAALSATPGWRASVWKDTTRMARSCRQELKPWLIVLLLSAGVAAAPDWGSRLVALVFWSQVAASRTTSRLGDNLGHWWLWRQQPFSSRQLVAMSIAPPALLLVILTLVASFLSTQLPWSPDFYIAPLLPFLGLPVSLAATWDLLRHTKAQRLLADVVPAVTATGWFLSLLITAAVLGISWLVVQLIGHWWAGLATGAIFALLIALVLASLVYKRAARLA